MKKIQLLVMMLLVGFVLVSCDKQETNTTVSFDHQAAYLNADTLTTMEDVSDLTGNPIEIRDIGIWKAVIYIEDQMICVVDKFSYEQTNVTYLHGSDFDAEYFKDLEAMVFYTENQYVIIDYAGIHTYTLTLDDDQYIKNVGIIDAVYHSVTINKYTDKITLDYTPYDAGFEYTTIYDQNHDNVMTGDYQYYYGNIFYYHDVDSMTLASRVTYYQFYQGEMTSLRTTDNVPADQILWFHNILIIKTYIDYDLTNSFDVYTFSDELVPTYSGSFIGEDLIVRVINDNYLEAYNSTYEFYDSDMNLVQSFSDGSVLGYIDRAIDQNYYLRINASMKTLKVYNYDDEEISSINCDGAISVTKEDIQPVANGLFLINSNEGYFIWDSQNLYQIDTLLNINGSTVYYTVDDGDGVKIYEHFLGGRNEIINPDVLMRMNTPFEYQLHLFSPTRFIYTLDSPAYDYVQLEVRNNGIEVYSGDIVSQNDLSYLIHTDEGDYIYLSFYEGGWMIVT